MRVLYYEGSDIATTDHDEPGRCVITWQEDDCRCDGWIEGEKLFAPADGTMPPGIAFLDDGAPDPSAKWYEVGTGKPAISGLPGATLAVFE